MLRGEQDEALRPPKGLLLAKSRPPAISSYGEEPTCSRVAGWPLRRVDQTHRVQPLGM